MREKGCRILVASVGMNNRSRFDFSFADSVFQSCNHRFGGRFPSQTPTDYPVCAFILPKCQITKLATPQSDVSYIADSFVAFSIFNITITCAVIKPLPLASMPEMPMSKLRPVGISSRFDKIRSIIALFSGENLRHSDAICKVRFAPSDTRFCRQHRPKQNCERVAA